MCGELNICKHQSPFLKCTVVKGNSINTCIVEEFYNNGTPKKTLYFWRRAIHRVDGPAELVYEIDGRLRSSKWWVDGTRLEK